MDAQHHISSLAIALEPIADSCGSAPTFTHSKPAQDATIRLDVVKYLVPMVAINVLGLDVNILCLVYADTYFYQVGEQEKVLTEKAPTRSI